jgi:hypothetical protein
MVGRRRYREADLLQAGGDLRFSALGPTRICRRGEIGRHAILRGWWGNPWEFESPRRHQGLVSRIGLKDWSQASRQGLQVIANKLWHQGEW